MTTRLSDAELINEIINRRGYLTIGSQIPLPLGLTLRSVDLATEGSFGLQPISGLSKARFYVFSKGEASDMSAQNELVRQFDCPKGTALGRTTHLPFYYRVRTD